MKELDSRNRYHHAEASERVGVMSKVIVALALIATLALFIVSTVRTVGEGVPVPRHIAYPGEAPRLFPRNGDIRMILEPSGDTLSLMYYQGQWYDLEEQSGSDYTNDPKGLKKL